MTRPTSRRAARARIGFEQLQSEHTATEALTWGDPARMTPADRLAELGTLLARGYVRQLESTSQLGLAVGSHSERVCADGVIDPSETRSASR